MKSSGLIEDYNLKKWFKEKTMDKNTFSKRQTHLDFHTSLDIEGIGSRFSKENFQSALKAGNLESITVFAKCHHGVC